MAKPKAIPKPKVIVKRKLIVIAKSKQDYPKLVIAKPKAIAL